MRVSNLPTVGRHWFFLTNVPLQIIILLLFAVFLNMRNAAFFKPDSRRLGGG